MVIRLEIPGIGERQIRDAADAQMFSSALDHKASYYADLPAAVKDGLRLQLAEYLPTPKKPRQRVEKGPSRPIPPLPDSPQARLFIEHAPRRPYCTNDYDRYGHGRILDLARAIQFRYIKLNTESLLLTLPFDIDQGVETSWERAATPTWIACNPSDNGRGHAGYAMEIPVRMDSDNSRAMRLAAAVEQAYVGLLGADCSLAKKWCKNPLHPDWRVQWPLEGKPISLTEMAEYVENLGKFMPKRIRPYEAAGLGRNCSLFESLRQWAYRHFSTGQSGFYERFLAQVQAQAAEINSYFAEALSAAEVSHTAKSVASWTWQKYRPSSEAGISRGRDGNGRTRHLGFAVADAQSHIAFDELPAPLAADEILRRKRQAALATAAQRALETRAAIIAAIGALAARGEPISTRKLAAESGLPRSTLMYHADLLRSVDE